MLYAIKGQIKGTETQIRKVISVYPLINVKIVPGENGLTIVHFIIAISTDRERLYKSLQEIVIQSGGSIYRTVCNDLGNGVFECFNELV